VGIPPRPKPSHIGQIPRFSGLLLLDWACKNSYFVFANTVGTVDIMFSSQRGRDGRAVESSTVGVAREPLIFRNRENSHKICPKETGEALLY
jgi:hypothetical protein